MKFIEIERTVKANSKDVDAIYRISEKKGIGALRFTKKGSQVLQSTIKKLDTTKPFKIFIDKESHSLAFKQDEKGQFKLSHSKKQIYTLSYADLKKQIGTTTFYKLETSKDYTFILVAVKDENS